MVVGMPAEFGESGRKHAAWRYNLIALSEYELSGAICVARYSAAKNEIELRESNDCQSRPQGKHQADRKSAG